MMLTSSRSRGSRGGHGVDQPRVVQLQVSRYTRTLPTAKEPLEFLVGVHVEGTPIAWQRNVTMKRAVERELLDAIDGLRRWSAGLGLTTSSARAAGADVGRILRDVFLGSNGAELLDALDRTALLLVVDETIMHLPWEMMLDGADAPLVLRPFGRVVTTRLLPPTGRDPTTEDPKVRILAVENPTDDLGSTERIMETIEGLREWSGDLAIEVTTLARKEATRDGFRTAITGGDFDVIHFAGHGSFDTETPSDGAVRLADGSFGDDQVASLAWKRPPFIVMNGSCESARSAAGVRIVSNRRRSNGLAAAFLSRGVEAYLGHYFLVDDVSAAEFSNVFYSTLLQQRNVGQAVQQAREDALGRWVDDGELTALGAVFFGDAGTAERRDLATAA